LKEFVKKTEHTFYGLNTGGNNARNYRNDENVLIVCVFINSIS